MFLFEAAKKVPAAAKRIGKTIRRISSKYKKLWISNNIQQPDEIIVTGRKESYAKNKASGTPNILIDDRPVNIQRWQGAGGYGILYQANRDSLEKVKKGLEDYAKVQRDQ